MISAPGGDDVDATIVYGVNHGVLKASHTVISNASCTTNCLAPLAKVLNDSVGIAAGVMTTIHSYTNDQVLVDVYHTDLRRARSATHSMIPTKTGAAAAVGLVMPELKGKLDGFAIRVPTINVSLVDLSFTAKRATSVDEINGLMKSAAASGPLQGILAYTDAPLVSVDYNHDSALVGLRRDHDQSDRGHAGQGLRLVRQRMGVLEPHARHHARLVARNLRPLPHETAAHGRSGSRGQTRPDPRGPERAGEERGGDAAMRGFAPHCRRCTWRWRRARG